MDCRAWSLLRSANVPAIRNQLGLHNAESVLQRAYLEGAQTNPAIPREPGIVPALLERVRPVHEAVHVDYFLPGCPPSAERIKAVLTQLLARKEPKLQPEQLKAEMLPEALAETVVQVPPPSGADAWALVCRGMTCLPPISTSDELLETIKPAN